MASIDGWRHVRLCGEAQAAARERPLRWQRRYTLRGPCGHVRCELSRVVQSGRFRGQRRYTVD